MWGKIEILLTSIASCHFTLHLGGLTDVAQLIRDICKQKQNHKVQRIQRASFAMGLKKVDMKIFETKKSHRQWLSNTGFISLFLNSLKAVQRIYEVVLNTFSFLDI